MDYNISQTTNWRFLPLHMEMAFLKLYEGNSPLFANIPKEISRVLLHQFWELLQSDISTITEHDGLKIPL